jgi:putative YphP/YqiW family bacilliredoxin
LQASGPPAKSKIPIKTILDMPYPEQLVRPMREELTRAGIKELLDADSVDAVFNDSEGKTQLLVINSVCGCAAANARPAVLLSLQGPTQPDEYITVFAGQDIEATAHVREHLIGIPPSSPFISLFKDGEPVFVLERRHIEGRSASAIAMDLVQAYGTYCGGNGEAPDTQTAPEGPEAKSDNGLPPTFRSIL